METVALGGYAVPVSVNPMGTTLPIAGLASQRQDIQQETPPILASTMDTAHTPPVDTSVQPTTNLNRDPFLTVNERSFDALFTLNHPTYCHGLSLS